MIPEDTPEDKPVTIEDVKAEIEWARIKAARARAWDTLFVKDHYYSSRRYEGFLERAARRRRRER
jgi:hypothetical protein